ncbi:MAG: hypothetical protein IPJ17_09395 [Holophagales bacterium]|nr:MAG: hypothetical protein IPJ17_09395 [Holophagales bacterium]
MERSIRWRTVRALVAAGALVVASAAGALEPVNKSFFGGLAVHGYDVVAYFADGKAVEGSDAVETSWHGATWRFASAAHRDLFVAAPERYAPQYGGYCAWAVSQGYTADGDPESWKIVDGKLYLNYNREIQQRWEADIPGLVTKADANWPKLLGAK